MIARPKSRNTFSWPQCPMSVRMLAPLTRRTLPRNQILRSAAAAGVEALETRVLLSAGELDETLGTGGIVHQGQELHEAERAAVFADGSVIIAGGGVSDDQDGESG